MHVKSHVCQPDGDGSSHRGFPYTTFAHQHNQAVFTASDIIDQAREISFQACTGYSLPGAVMPQNGYPAVPSMLKHQPY